MSEIYDDKGFKVVYYYVAVVDGGARLEGIV